MNPTNPLGFQKNNGGFIFSVRTSALGSRPFQKTQPAWTALQNPQGVASVRIFLGDVLMTEVLTDILSIISWRFLGVVFSINY